MGKQQSLHLCTNWALLLHKTSSIDEDEDMYSRRGHERDANAFAGELLVPDRFLREICDIKRPGKANLYDAWLEEHSKQWGVSAEVILRRLLDVGRLSQAQYTAYRSWRQTLVFNEGASGSRKYRYREPEHVFGSEFVCTVLDALSAQRITLARASTYLDNLKVKDLHKLRNWYARF